MNDILSYMSVPLAEKIPKAEDQENTSVVEPLAENTSEVQKQESTFVEPSVENISEAEDRESTTPVDLLNLERS